MKKTLALMTTVLLSSAAWAGGDLTSSIWAPGDRFNNTPDLSNSILLDVGKPAGMGEREMGRGDLYGTSLKAFGGDVSTGMAGHEGGTGDLYGNVIYDVNYDQLSSVISNPHF